MCIRDRANAAQTTGDRRQNIAVVVGFRWLGDVWGMMSAVVLFRSMLGTVEAEVAARLVAASHTSEGQAKTGVPCVGVEVAVAMAGMTVASKSSTRI